MDFTKQSPVILSLCPGMRGLERGFERACEQLNWKLPVTAAYVEIEAFICWNLVKQMEQGLLAPAPIHTNIKTFDGKPFRNKIHGIFGGYPCQPFSLAGERKGTEDPRHLWPYISGIIESVRSVFCFFENVSGHLSMGFPEVYRGLRDLGYTVECGIFTAEEVGAPHERKRLFILAIRNDMANAMRSGFGSEIGKTRRGIRKQNVRQGNGSECTVWINAAGRESELANTNSQRCGETGQCSERLNISGELGNTEMSECEQSSGTRTRPDGFTDDGSENNNKFQRWSTEYDRKLAGRNDEELSNSDEQGCKRGEQFGENNGGRFGISCEPVTKLHSGSTKDQWPASPGKNQHEWEAPRVESRLGFTAHGYNFREDLLRMAGNGVVEQTAELAFLTLLEKFK